ncbi:uncharacterized protein AKAW2_31561A [Aspergillus luchuensis]|uniref:Azaphilone pigments biosynthesis cluster protein L N-terminal domain-containing protein n=1 Tax=Aspergillus kawachii TaxID=1069201 RepID=A0A7R7W8B8_ASPKA|nr:uncharacterized protein AKAW2_31561A [Aspergillus luchuensis]KAI2967298.1 hypothetical protein CBS147324_7075 [Aspergillus niger]KAI3037221.1 hypothetical protein CBS147352_11082 [Aspergillus niger]BCR98242.1 hypothetical protein AKAW2_31561A [Aspergillus luchuensis]GAA92069.1 hypothetical protein AKAW_10183 [Aspergillus luchuensis IFO 4308]
MADALSVASSLIALATFAFEASKSLYALVEGFKNTQRTVRELRYELESLTQVLGTLISAVMDNEAELASLKLPLLRCGKICSEFREIIRKCVAHSNGQRTSFRDWAKLQYMGGNIVDLKTTLAGYKATISIALGGATFRQATVASAVIDQYKTMIEEATSDLQEHLQNIEERLQSLDQHGGPVQRSDTFHLQDIREEKESTEQCLTICTHVAQVIAHFQQQLPQFHSKGENISIQFGSGNDDISGQSQSLTSAMLTDFGARVSSNSEALQARLMELTNRLRQMSEQGIMYKDPTNLNLIKEERESIIQCLNVCSEASDLAHRARTNIFEDVTSSDESHQLVVSTIGDLISAKHIITGSKSAQWLGQMSDTSLQQLSRDFRGQVGIGEEPPSRAEKNEFNTRYGSGQLLGEDSPRRRTSPSDKR